MDSQEIRELRVLIRQMRVLANDAESRLSRALDDEPPSPGGDPREAIRVERFGEVAHRHLLVIEQNGEMTLGESLAIRREMFGDKVRSTANLFGVQDSGALFYRKTPHGKTRNDADQIDLTEEGKRIAQLWRDQHIEVAATR